MQKLLGFTGGNCRHIVAFRLCSRQSAMKKIIVSRGGARAPVPHSWRRQWSVAIFLTISDIGPG